MKNNKTNKNVMEEKTMKKFNNAEEIATYLEDHAFSKGLIDVGNGVAQMLGVTDDELKEAIDILKGNGYYLTEFDVLVKEDEAPME